MWPRIREKGSCTWIKLALFWTWSLLTKIVYTVYLHSIPLKDCSIYTEFIIQAVYYISHCTMNGREFTKYLDNSDLVVQYRYVILRRGISSLLKRDQSCYMLLSPRRPPRYFPESRKLTIEPLNGFVLRLWCPLLVYIAWRWKAGHFSTDLKSNIYDGQRQWSTLTRQRERLIFRFDKFSSITHAFIDV